MRSLTKELQRIKEEALLRGYSDKTINSYVWCLQKFFERIDTTPSNITKEDVREYILILIKNKYERATIRLVIAAIKFYFLSVRNQKIDLLEIPLPKRKRKLPKVLPKEDIKNMIELTKNIKHKLLIMLLYSSGLRLSEIRKLRIQDLDPRNNTIRVNQGKGNKDRLTIFSSRIKEELLDYICSLKEPEIYLFPGRKGTLSVKSIQLIISKAAKRAQIIQKVTPHMLRHSFATHILEEGVDIRYIQALLGHSRLETTQIYTKVSKMNIKNFPNPLDFIY